MKKIISIWMAVALLVGILSGCGGSNTQPNGNASNDAAGQEEEGASLEKIIVGLDENFPPMGFKQDGEIVGFDVDLAKATGEKMGVAVEFQPIDWNSKELELDAEKIDLIWNGLTITEERKQTMLFTRPYVKNKQIILVPGDSPIQTKQDLAGKKVGLQDGSSAETAVNSDPMSASIEEIVKYNDNILAFLDLETGRIDAVVVDVIVAGYYIQQEDKNFVILEEDFGSEEFGIATKPGRTDLIEKVQTALDEVIADGTATEISNKWFREDIVLKPITKIVVGLDENFPPMGFKQDGEIVGFDVDLAKATGEKIGAEIEFQPIDWNSKELELNAEKIDLIWNGLTITEERKQTMLFTKPYVKNKQIILVPGDSPIQTKQDLAGKKIGLQDGSSAETAVGSDAMSSAIGEIVKYNDNILAFLDLETGRIDAVVVDVIVAGYYIQQEDKNFVILEDDFGSEEFGIAAKLGRTDLIDAVQTALDEVIANGTAAEISEKWFGEDILIKE